MPASFYRRFRALDLAVSITSSVPELDLALDTLTSCYEATTEPEVCAYTLERTSHHVLSLNDAVLYASPSAHDALGALELDLYHQVRGAAQGRWLVHAATVELGGRGLVLVGASGAGKSTMALALLGRGARYVTDEMTLIDERGTCRGLGRPLTLDAAPDATFTRGMRVAAAGLGPSQSVWIVPPADQRMASPLARHTWVSLGRGPREVRRLSSGDALRAFWSESLTSDARAFAVASEVVSTMPAYAVRGESIAESADLLAALLVGPGPN